MGKKFGIVVLIIGFVILAYVILTACMPAINAIVTSVNSSANYTNYPGAQEGIVSAPLWLYFLPALVGTVLIVVTLKSKRI